LRVDPGGLDSEQRNNGTAKVPSDPEIGAARLLHAAENDFPAARAKGAFYQGLKGRDREKIALRVDGNLSTVG
jgi:hypothetical protein